MSWCSKENPIQQLISFSSKQKLNTTSSTVAELVGVNDAMGLVLWTRLFLTVQGFTVTDNIVFQDNQSAMLLEKNGKRSSGKKTRHIEIQYYFVTDNIKRNNMSVMYCPTAEMIADFFTKPLQGSLFRKFRAFIMNLPPEVVENQLQEAQECVEAAGGADGPKHEECFSAADKPTYAEVARMTELAHMNEDMMHTE